MAAVVVPEAVVVVQQVKRREFMTFTPIERQGIVVWGHHFKQLKTLRRYGHLQYTSRRMKYGVVYCNCDDVESVVAKLKTLNWVKKVEVSQRPFIKTTYTTIENPNIELEYHSL